MAIDVDAARADTPACERLVHLNHAGASPSPTPVVDVVVDHLRREAEIGGYEAAEESADRVEAVYASVAALVGGSADEIALVESATRAWNAAFHAIALSPGDRILTGRAEYVSNAISLLRVAERTGATVEVVDDDASGQISLDQLAQRLDDRVAVVALTHVPTSGGLVNPAEEVGRLVADHRALYLLDACQSAGQIDLDVARLGCDVLTATGRKFLRGPRGTGFAWVSRAVLDRLEPHELDTRSASWTGPDTYEMRGDARRFESWESSIAGRLGLGAAVDYAIALGPAEIERRVTDLADRFRAALAAVTGVRVHDKGERRCGIVTFDVADRPAAAVRGALADEGINVWVTSAAQARFDLPARGLDELVRASLHYVTTDDELDRSVDVVARVASRAA
ncbi:MAG: aminotransferase class V-fold PLP-dependent enzyme [Acidimicrobiales bacterium]